MRYALITLFVLIFTVVAVAQTGQKRQAPRPSDQLARLQAALLRDLETLPVDERLGTLLRLANKSVRKDPEFAKFCFERARSLYSSPEIASIDRVRRISALNWIITDYRRVILKEDGREWKDPAIRELGKLFTDLLLAETDENGTKNLRYAIVPYALMILNLDRDSALRLTRTATFDPESANVDDLLAIIGALNKTKPSDGDELIKSVFENSNLLPWMISEEVFRTPDGQAPNLPARLTESQFRLIFEWIEEKMIREREMISNGTAVRCSYIRVFGATALAFAKQRFAEKEAGIASGIAACRDSALPTWEKPGFDWNTAGPDDLLKLAEGMTGTDRDNAIMFAIQAANRQKDPAKALMLESRYRNRENLQPGYNAVLDSAVRSALIELFGRSATDNPPDRLEQFLESIPEDRRFYALIGLVESQRFQKPDQRLRFADLTYRYFKQLPPPDPRQTYSYYRNPADIGGLVWLYGSLGEYDKAITVLEDFVRTSEQLRGSKLDGSYRTGRRFSFPEKMAVDLFERLFDLADRTEDKALRVEIKIELLDAVMNPR